MMRWMLLFFFPATAWATESAVQPLSLGNVFSMIFSLALVVGLVLGGAWLIRRLQQVRGALPNQQTIQVVAVQQLGLKDRVVLLQVGDEQILVGSSAAGLRTLHAWRTVRFKDQLEAMRPTPAAEPRS